MDLVHYEPAHPFDLQGRAPGSAENTRRDVQGQAAAWLRNVILKVVPGFAARAGGTDKAHG